MVRDKKERKRGRFECKCSQDYYLLILPETVPRRFLICLTLYKAGGKQRLLSACESLIVKMRVGWRGLCWSRTVAPYSRVPPVRATLVSPVLAQLKWEWEGLEGRRDYGKCLVECTMKGSHRYSWQRGRCHWRKPTARDRARTPTVHILDVLLSQSVM